MKRRKPICLYCEAKPRLATAGTLSVSHGDYWQMYFCSRKCALDWAGSQAGYTNEWCEHHGCWHHPDDEECNECPHTTEKDIAKATPTPTEG